MSRLKAECKSAQEGKQDALACINGIYSGHDRYDGAPCTVTVSANGYVTFTNGVIKLNPFRLEEDIQLKFSEDEASGHWRLSVKAWNAAEPFLITDRRQHLELSVDTRHSNQVWIRQFNREARLGGQLDTTCVSLAI